jgi:hypothetical protein
MISYIFKDKFIISVARSSCFATRYLLAGLSESSGKGIERFPCRYHSTTALHAHISPMG